MVEALRQKLALLGCCSKDTFLAARRPNMSMTGRISELSSKHHALEEKITEEEKRPAADITHISSLKREKLRIKEELRMLRAS
jgi:hypothetical protein